MESNKITLKSIRYVAGVFALLIVGLIITLQIEQPKEAIGSVVEGQEYQATTTRAFDGTALTNLTVLKNRAGSLARVTITGAGAGQMVFYDATTTDATARTNTATTTIANFPASAAAGTYDFDAVFNYGLIYEVIGDTATSSIMWR